MGTGNREGNVVKIKRVKPFHGTASRVRLIFPLRLELFPEHEYHGIQDNDEIRGRKYDGEEHTVLVCQS